MKTLFTFFMALLISAGLSFTACGDKKAEGDTTDSTEANASEPAGEGSANTGGSAAYEATGNEEADALLARMDVIVDEMVAKIESADFSNEEEAQAYMQGEEMKELTTRMEDLSKEAEALNESGNLSEDDKQKFEAAATVIAQKMMTAMMNVAQQQMDGAMEGEGHEGHDHEGEGHEGGH